MINFEIWKPIKDFESKYEISNLGRLRNKFNNHIYKFTNKNGDYFSAILYDDLHKKSVRIHRLVAETFIENPNNYPVVNHKDMNKQNNRADNLEWCTCSQNNIHAIKNGAKTMSGFNRYNKNKFKNKYGKIYQCDKEKNIIKIYNSLEEAYLETGVCKRNILHVMNHEEGRTQAGGYVWLSEKEVVGNDL